MAKKVYLGVGHGGSDPGAVGNGFKEKDLNLTIALACKKELERHKVQVKISRTTDKAVWLEERIAQANAFDADLAADIHINAGGGKGAEVYHSVNGGEGKSLALNIMKEFKAIGQNAHSTKPSDYKTGAKVRKNSSGADYFGFIRQTKMTAVLVENAFIDNKEDIKLLNTAAKQKALGVAIAKGILKTLEIPYQAEKPTKTSNTIYRIQLGAYSSKSNAEKQLKKVKAAGFKEAVIVAEKK